MPPIRTEVPTEPLSESEEAVKSDHATGAKYHVEVTQTGGHLLIGDKSTIGPPCVDGNEFAGYWPLTDSFSPGPALEKGFYDELKSRHHNFGQSHRGKWYPTRKMGIRVPPVTRDFQEKREDHYTDEEILSQLIPLEEKCRSSGSSQDDQLVQLARFSQNKSAPTGVGQSLKLLLHFLRKEYTKSAVNAHIRVMEQILRQTILCESGIFIEERTHAQRLRVDAYSHVFYLLIVGLVNGSLPQCFSETENQQLKMELRPKLATLLKNPPYNSQDRMRYSMEIIIKGIGWISSPKLCLKLRKLKETKHMLEQMICQECTREDARQLLQHITENSKSGWFNMHFVMYWLYAQVMRKARSQQALQLLDLIIVERRTELAKKRKGKNKHDWKFVLLAVNILTDILLNSNQKDIGHKASRSVSQLIRCENIRKSPDLRTIVEKYSDRAILGADAKERETIIRSLFKENQEVQTYTCLKHLSAFYKIHNLEIIEVIHDTERTAIARTNFQSCPAIIKVKKTTTSTLCLERKPSVEHEWNFFKEAYYLWRLNQENKPNILHLFAFDTIGPLCHVITEYMPKGTARQFLLNCRQQQSLPSVWTLLKMCKDVAEAMIALAGENIVHGDLRADVVYVDSSNNCKLAGFKYAKQIKREENASKKTLGLGREHGLDWQRWAPPECLRIGQQTVKSDVWAFAVYMYEVFTIGGIPYTTVLGLEEQEIEEKVLSGERLPFHSCIPPEVYDLMTQCWECDKEKRPTFIEIHRNLKEIEKQQQKSDSKPLPNPPPLKPRKHSLFEETPKAKITVAKSKALKRITVDGVCRRHLESLRSLDNPYIVRVFSVEILENSMRLVVENTSCASLLDYVKTGSCKESDLVLYAAQIANAMKYLHSKDIIHCHLAAENIAVANPDQVQVCGLQHCRTLIPSYDDEDSSTCITRRELPKGSLRWCPPEAIQENIFSHASDVWSFGVMLWELFINLGPSENSTTIMKPYPNLEDKQLLPAFKRNIRLRQPENCPDWLYIVMTRCWLYNSFERPSFFWILDCLTNSNPWVTYLLQLWMEKHEIYENWPNTHVALPKHVRDVGDGYHTESELRAASTEEFRSDHTYCYEEPFWKKHVRKFKNPFKKMRSSISSKETDKEKVKKETSKFCVDSESLEVERPLLSSPRDDMLLPSRKYLSQTKEVGTLEGKHFRKSQSMTNLLDRPKTKEVFAKPPCPPKPKTGAEGIYEKPPPLPPRSYINQKTIVKSHTDKHNSLQPIAENIYESLDQKHRTDTEAFKTDNVKTSNWDKGPLPLSRFASQDSISACRTEDSSHYSSLYDSPSASIDTGSIRSSSLTCIESDANTLSNVDSLSVDGRFEEVEDCYDDTLGRDNKRFTDYDEDLEPDGSADDNTDNESEYIEK